MNFKKIKKSLVSAVLGSSLFLVNEGVICQQPKAWLTDGFFTVAKEKYEADPNIQLLLIVLEFLSDLSRPSTLNTGSPSRTKEDFDLQLHVNATPCLNGVLIYLEKLELLQKISERLSGGPAELRKRLEKIDRSYKLYKNFQSESTANSHEKNDILKLETLVLILIISTHPDRFTDEVQDAILRSLDVLFQTNNQAKNSENTIWLISALHSLFTN